MADPEDCHCGTVTCHPYCHCGCGGKGWYETPAWIALAVFVLFFLFVKLFPARRKKEVPCG